jgi:hypothetical protein
MSDRLGGGIFGNDVILWFIIVFLILFWGFGGFGAGGCGAGVI